jgi:hypothetical protein
MALSFRILYWIPVVFFFSLNLFFKFIIEILKLIGNAVVWINRKCVFYGDKFTDKAQTDNNIDKWVEKVAATVEKSEKIRGKR